LDIAVERIGQQILQCQREFIYARDRILVLPLVIEERAFCQVQVRGYASPEVFLVIKVSSCGMTKA
jgi:hypothetical protein